MPTLNVSKLLMLGALVLFLLAAVGVGQLGPFSLGWAGLAVMAGAFVVA